MTKIENKDYQQSKWSGGTTTQLLIWPPKSDYKTRKFKFRISSATIEDEQSEFTKLPGVYRYLSVLAGELELTITEAKNSYKKSLNPFKIFSFWGDQEVSSKGKVRDFNLMLQQCNGKLEAKKIQKREVLESPPGCFFLYLDEGKVSVEKLDSNQGIQELESKDSLYEISQEHRSYVITSDLEAKIMVAWIEI